MAYTGSERRKYPRASGRFIVSYRILEEKDATDISQSKNLSLGGMLLTTNRQFEPGTNLALQIRLPFDPNPIILVGKVIESRQIAKDLLYDTRLTFIAVDDKHKDAIKNTVTHYSKKG